MRSDSTSRPDVIQEGDELDDVERRWFDAIHRRDKDDMDEAVQAGVNIDTLNEVRKMSIQRISMITFSTNIFFI